MKTTATTRKLSVNPTSSNGTKKMTLEEVIEQKEALSAQLEAIRAAEEAYEQEQASQKKILQAAKEAEYREMIEEAEYNDKLAIQATTEYDRKAFIREAIAVRKKANELYPEFSTQTETSEEIVTGVDWKRGGIILSGLLSLLLFSWTGFELIRQKIIAFNSTLTIENMTSAMQPYGFDSFQKLFFEGFVTVIDLIVLYGILWILDNSGFKYVSSFIRGKHNSTKEFDELSPWQRQLKTTILLASVLLYLALRHLVKA